MVRLVIVDDQALVREGLSLILDAHPDLTVVAALPDGPALLDFVAERPEAVDVILLDLYLPGVDGVRVLGRLRQRFPDLPARVVMLTTIGRATEIRAALAAGADGFVLKDATGEELAAAVRGAHGGVTPLSASAVAALWPSVDPAGLADPAAPPVGRADARPVAGDGVTGRSGPAAPAVADPLVARVATLTPREREILDLLGQGLANQQIARTLRLAERTVKTHVSSVLAKLQVTSRTQAALLLRDLPTGR
ncbi:response regulator [Micromonospora fluostatini]|uniref:response regulator n=1 Tax=Micromonospora sp. JCM 30529 TaxID=3421643 RepID=UPI003D16DFD4